MADAQNFKNHRRFVPPFHFVLMPILLVNFLFMAYHVWQNPGRSTAWSALMAFALIMIALFGRIFAMTAQDRVIRLEEHLRMRELLPAELKTRIPEFTKDQLIGLRFASDAELPELAATVLRDNIKSRETIKKMVKHWRADDLRV
jgi:hypothetical protein